MELPKHYNPSESEIKLQEKWDELKIYDFDEDSKDPVFSVDTPPPTLSGNMHMGHAFSYSHTDFLVRFKRMNGFNVFYPFGTDDNGLPTDKLVEKLNKVKSSKMKRDEYLKLCNETLEKIRPKLIAEFKRLGLSADFKKSYSTISESSRKISQASFINLYNKGREYRKKAPTMWCPVCHTAISQAELEDKELPSNFNDIIFKVDGEDLTIATTRPELLPACVAIFAHPDDKRYKLLFGKHAVVPIFNHEVPILPDKRADPEKGTGVVMCCTFGDQTDIEWYKAHNLPLRIAIDKFGKMTDLAKDYKSLPVVEARKKIIDDLKNKNLLTNQKPIHHIVNVHERCGNPIEILESYQWFVKYLDMKDHFLESGAKLNWFPKHMKVRLDNWINGLQWDWCISRQRYFGIPFPVWYSKKTGETILADLDQLPVDPLYDKPKTLPKDHTYEDIEPEKDVIDTWATSSLSPKICQSLTKKKIYPMSLRPQAHDIITFWLFNTMVKSNLEDDINPWDDVMISGFVLNPNGKGKLSKSKGGSIAPEKVMGEYSADALRYWAAGVKLGDDLPLMDKDIRTGQKTVTKLWNASKFCIMNLEDYDPLSEPVFQIFDKWLLSKLNNIIKTSTETFNNYEYSRTKAEIDNFFWNTFCDYYLEIIKNRIYGDDEELKTAAKATLYNSLLTILKLFAPIMPHITDEIYGLYFNKHEKAESIHKTSWPVSSEKLIDPSIEKAGDQVIKIISEIRKYKSQNKLSLKSEINKLTVESDLDLSEFENDLLAVTNTQNIEYGPADNEIADKLKITIS